MKIMKFLPVMLLVFNFLLVESVSAQKELALRDGMVRVKGKPFMMGPNDESVLSAQKDENRMVTVSDFWMDETEVTNAQYREFVNWVRDSIAMRRMIDVLGDDCQYVLEDPYGRELDEPRLNWAKRAELQKEYKKRVNPDEPANEALSDMFYDGILAGLRTNMLHYVYS